METFLNRLKEIERVIEKFLDGLENTEEELWNEDERCANVQERSMMTARFPVRNIS